MVAKSIKMPLSRSQTGRRCSLFRSLAAGVPFGGPLARFGSLLAPFWSPFGTLLAPFWIIFPPFLVRRHAFRHPNPQKAPVDGRWHLSRRKTSACPRTRSGCVASGNLTSTLGPPFSAKTVCQRLVGRVWLRVLGPSGTRPATSNGPGTIFLDLGPVLDRCYFMLHGFKNNCG